MALINCPECNNEISDKAVSCPICGYPISAVNTNTATDQLSNSDVGPSDNTPKIKKQINIKKIGIISGISILCIIIISVVVIILNFQSIQLNRANKYMENTQYTKAVKVLEKYKDDDDVKELYDKALFMTTDEGKFLTDFAAGLMERWDYSTSPTELTDLSEQVKEYTDCVNIEINKLSKYKDMTFQNEMFNKKAHAYLDALQAQLDALSYCTTDYAKYSIAWDKAYNDRAVLIAYFLNNYPVNINDKYADTKSEFLYAAKQISEEKEFAAAVDAMIHENSFALTKDDMYVKTYSIQVENKTDKVFKTFELLVTYLDKDGSIIFQTYTNQIKSFAPGQKANFEVTTDKKADSLKWEANYYVE